jgi:hypothetical protein
MVTVIDYSPSAIDTASISQATEQIAKTLGVPKGTADSLDNPTAKRENAQKFSTGRTELMFVAEYAPQDTFIGTLLVWERYYSATHYEVYKRNITSSSTSWSRILFIDKASLTTETESFKPYIKDKLGLDIDRNYYAILDTGVKDDRIYEYKVVASFYPTSSEIDFSSILESKGLVTFIDATNSADTVFEVSAKTLGSESFAWIIALLNDRVSFFGRAAATNPAHFDGSKVIIPKTMTHIVQIIQESIHFFGIKSTFLNLLNKTRAANTLDDFFRLAVVSVDEQKNVMSYTEFMRALTGQLPAFSNLNKLIQGSQAKPTTAPLDVYRIQLMKQAVEKIPVSIPTYDDVTSFDNITSLTLMFFRINSILIAALYAQDNEPAIKKALNPLGGGV